jgi:hypothetical protein
MILLSPLLLLLLPLVLIFVAYAALVICMSIAELFQLADKKS